MPQKQLNLKRTNARVMKWIQMINNGLDKDEELLIRRTRKGIPASVRIKAWPEIIAMQQKKQRIKANKNKSSNKKEPQSSKKPKQDSLKHIQDMRKSVSFNRLSYSTILLKDSYDVYDIKLDIPRTFSFQSQQILRDSLFNVLKALSIEFPLIGYCQGMNFLCMRLLEILDDENVFKIMCYLIKTYRSLYDNFRNPGFVNRQNQIFEVLFKKTMPKIHKRLQQQCIDPVMYTTSWFLTLFSKSLEKQKFYRFFQCLLVQGQSVIYKTALGLMKLKEKQLLKNNLQENLIFVSDMKFYQDIDDDQFILKGVFDNFQDSNINEIQIQKRQNDYNYQNKNLIKNLEESVQDSYKKKVEQPRTVLEWNLQDFKKSDFDYVRFKQQ